MSSTNHGHVNRLLELVTEMKEDLLKLSMKIDNLKNCDCHNNSQQKLVEELKEYFDSRPTTIINQNKPSGPDWLALEYPSSVSMESRLPLKDEKSLLEGSGH